MRGFNFTDQVRSALARAREEAHALNHEYCGTEHILLGLLRETHGVAAEVMQALSVDTEQLRQVTLGMLTMGNGGHRSGPDLPYTSRAKRSLELAMAQADEWGHSYVGTEHLLIGLLREEQCIAAQVMMHGGLSLDAVLAQTLSLLGEQLRAEPRGSDAAAVRSVVVEIHLRDGAVRRREFSDSRDAVAYLLRH